LPLSFARRSSRLIASDAVVLFMKGSRSFPQCGFSAAMVQILDSMVPNYTTVNVLADPAVRDGIKAFSDWPTIPQLYVKGEFVGGSDIVRQLHASGELADPARRRWRPRRAAERDRHPRAPPRC
jgi:monothiol glutaredoxin